MDISSSESIINRSEFNSEGIFSKVRLQKVIIFSSRNNC